MDLKSLMNMEDKGKEQASSRASIGKIAQPPTPLRTNGQPPATTGQGSPSHNRTPLYGSQATTPAQASQSYGMTPLFTPQQSPGTSQYPFPAQSAQSTALAAPYQQARQYDPHAVTTPYGRPSSHGSTFATPHPPSALLTGGTAPPYSGSSVSPTPSSHQSHTPQSVRQSPGVASSHQSYSQHPYQQAQPNSPFAAPPLTSQRSSGLPEPQPAFHQRTLSSASNGIITGSPSQHAQGLPYLTGSPLAYHRQSPQARRQSDRSHQASRQRSQSPVSPKTQPTPRQSSLDSRQSNTLSDRSSSQAPAVTHILSPIHVTQAQTFNAVQALGDFPSNNAGRVPQHASKLLVRGTTPFEAPSTPDAGPSLSANGPQDGSSIIQHRSERLPMSRLLSSTDEFDPSKSDRSDTASIKKDETAELSKSIPGMSTSRLLGQSDQTPIITEDQADRRHPGQALPNSVQPHFQRPIEQQRSSHEINEDGNDALHSSPSERDIKPALKRRADSDITIGPPHKKQRKMQRPIWAQLSPHNPQYNPHEQPNGVTNRPNKEVNADESKPWLADPPLDYDLINARRALGRWEKTFKWQTPYPDMLKALQDWLWMQLEQLHDVDPSMIEIEAKIGTLLREGSTDRCNLPIANAAVIPPEANGRFHFESRMTLLEHKAMNAFLNDTIKASMAPGRAQMSYQHIHETDYFRALSPEGAAALPQAVKKRPQLGREPRLRTTMEQFKDPKKEPKLKARIVKTTLGHLHIFNPQYNYDCRISVNIEVNLNGFDPATITLDPETSGRPDPPPRVKDRVSYKHLAYQIDLTKVEMGGLEPSYELELEVDATLLRRQMELAKRGELHAFGDVVAGFLDNATFLMRQRPT